MIFTHNGEQLDSELLMFSNKQRAYVELLEKQLFEKKTELHLRGINMNEFNQNIRPASAEDLLRPMYTAASGLQYPQKLAPENKERVTLELQNTNLVLYKANVGSLSGEEFTMIRRNGFGSSDSGILLGVNPYTSLHELIAQKASTTLSEEEKQISNQVAVIKGNDLEPLIIEKFENIFDMPTLKPTDMYSIKDFEYLKMNFDGVTGTPDQYIPAEIKVVTAKGEKNYNPFKAIYVEGEGFSRILENYAETNNTIQTKAAQYGIPPYYYTQLQQEMMALNAPFGYLCSLWERPWKIHVYFIHKDEAVWNALKIAGFNAWQKVLALREKNNVSQDFTDTV